MGFLTGKVTHDTLGSRTRPSIAKRMRSCMSNALVDLLFPVSLAWHIPSTVIIADRPHGQLLGANLAGADVAELPRRRSRWPHAGI